MRRTDKAPPRLEADCDQAEEQISRSFQDRREDLANATGEVRDARLVLVRGMAALEKIRRESASDYRDLFELSPDAIFVWDANGVIRAANESAASLLGYDKAENLIGRTWQGLVAPEDRQALAEEARRPGASAGASECEFRLLRSDGTSIFVQGRTRAFVGETENSAKTMVIARDISARKATEEAMHLSEARFRSAFEFAGHGMALIDLQARFLEVNPEFCRQAGYTEDEILARTSVEFIYPEDIGNILENVQRLNNGEIPCFETEIRYIRKSGEIVWVQINSSMVRDAAGAPLYHVVHVLDINGRRAAEAALLGQARHDQLTGLPNRPAFLERLEDAFAASRRGTGAFAVLYLDLDGFKDVNDTLGHVAGDRLLRAVATRLKNNVRESDVTARFGGDEFAVLQIGSRGPSDAGATAATLTKCLAAPYQIDGNDVRVTASVGISFYDPAIADPEEMLTQADLALYRAKEEGRDRYCFHSAELDRNVRERVTLSSELRAAIENHELELHYQPQVELASGRILGLEALVRWNHPRRGLLMPDLFIPIAERTGSIFALGRWVLGQACQQIKTWRDQGIAPPLVAINVSAAELRDYPEFEQFFTESLHRWSVAPGEIELELTESALMESTHTQMRGDALARIEALGTSVAIDDFGTGHSSLALLSAYPLNRLKIAQRFVRGVPDNARDVAITKATLSLARDLHVKVVAEGIETKAQLDFLVSAGCVVGQGFCFSRAAPAERAAELLRRGFIEPNFDEGREERQAAPA
jgi:diguanylate cyclase (GGDEF)-like protein/PAS domain S-box-containing protein